MKKYFPKSIKHFTKLPDKNIYFKSKEISPLYLPSSIISVFATFKFLTYEIQELNEIGLLFINTSIGFTCAGISAFLLYKTFKKISVKNYLKNKPELENKYNPEYLKFYTPLEIREEFIKNKNIDDWNIKELCKQNIIFPIELEKLKNNCDIFPKMHLANKYVPDFGLINIPPTAKEFVENFLEEAKNNYFIIERIYEDN